MEFGPWTIGTTQVKFEPVTVAGIPPQLTEASPERRSVAVPLTVTEGRFTTAPLAGAVMLRIGGVLSMLRIALTVAVFPALSTTDPWILWLAPSVVTVCGDEHVATPDVASEHVKLTVTSALFQPLAFGAGEAVAVIVGGVLSIFRLTLVLAVFPALSVAVPEMI